MDAASGRPELLRRAGELIAENYDFAIGAACFPEVHPEAPDMAHDLQFLKEKVDAGRDFLITQLFFDNELYFDFVEEARAAGIDVPIVARHHAGHQLRADQAHHRACAAPRSRRPSSASSSRAGGRPEALTELGVAYATLQCAELLARGAPGIHFYTLNRSPATRAILAALRGARPWDRTLAPV